MTFDEWWNENGIEWEWTILEHDAKALWIFWRHRIGRVSSVGSKKKVSWEVRTTQIIHKKYDL